MGEAKRRADAVRQATDEVTRQLGDKGMLIEGGWLALREVWIPKDAPPAQVKDLRWAFMAGAQHLYASIMAIMDPGREPTAADMRRLSLIAQELEAFRAEAESSVPTAGSA